MTARRAVLVTGLFLVSPALRAASSDLLSPPGPVPTRTPEFEDPVARREMQVHFLIASEFYKDGKYREAIDEWKEVLKIQPNHALAKEKIQRAREKIAAVGN